VIFVLEVDILFQFFYYFLCILCEIYKVDDVHCCFLSV